MRVGVIGGGPSGLAVAWELDRLSRDRAQTAEVEVFEREERPGGKVWTEAANGYLIERGPEGFLDSASSTVELAGELGLGDRLVSASGVARTRFIFAGGRLHPAPTTPTALIRSPLLSWRGRLRVLCEPLCRAGRAGDESVESFASRRLGREAAHKLVGSMVAGIYAGDPAMLSMHAAFPRLAALERRYGSLTRALLALRLEARRDGREVGGPTGAAGQLTSFRAGMRELVEGLGAALRQRLHLGSEVAAVRREQTGWCLTLAEGSDQRFDRLVVACEPWRAATLLRTVDAELARALAAIPPAPVAVVALGFVARELGASLDGGGFLVPRGEGVRILGSLWSSSVFPGRAPAGRVMVRVFMGGARDPEAVDLPEDRMVATALGDLEKTMGITAGPELVRIYRHPRAIPQYTLGHHDRVAAIEARLRGIPGLSVHGYGYRGVALNDCIRLARPVAAAVLEPAVRPAAP